MFVFVCCFSCHKRVAKPPYIRIPSGGGSYVDCVSTLPMLEEGYPSCGFRLETLTPVISASLIVILNREIFVVFFRSILKGICKLHLPFFSPQSVSQVCASFIFGIVIQPFKITLAIIIIFFVFCFWQIALDMLVIDVSL